MNEDFNSFDNTDNSVSDNSSSEAQEVYEYDSAENGESELVESGDNNCSCDCSAYIGDIASDSADLVVLVDTMNTNLCTLNDNLKFCTGLVFAVVFSILVHWGFKIFNDLFGLGKFN